MHNFSPIQPVCAKLSNLSVTLSSPRSYNMIDSDHLFSDALPSLLLLIDLQSFIQVLTPFERRWWVCAAEEEDAVDASWSVARAVATTTVTVITSAIVNNKQTGCWSWRLQSLALVQVSNPFYINNPPRGIRDTWSCLRQQTVYWLMFLCKKNSLPIIRKTRL